MKKSLENRKRNKEFERIPNFIIATGGTGGHIYPALRIAELIKEEIHSQANIYFVGARYGMEERIIGKKRSYPLYLLSIGRLNKNVSLFERVKTLIQLPFSFLKSLFLILKLKPDLILGLGGHASGPFLLMGVLLGKKTLIWEPNIHPGLANRILSLFVKKILISFSETKDSLKIKRKKNIFQVSYPVRKIVLDPEFPFSYEMRALETQFPEMKTNGFKLLVLGGSQGASPINTVVFNAYRKSKNLLTGIYVIHQTGEKDFMRMKSLFDEENENREFQREKQDQKENVGSEIRKEGITLVSVKAFLENIGEYYRWADLVLCRSGVGTLFELSSVRKPSILVPYPYSSDDHQFKNAKKWQSVGASILVLEKDLTPEGLIQILSELKDDRNKMTKLFENAKKFYPFNGRNKDWLPHLEV